MLRFGIVAFLLCIPVTAHAQILIQEIMYAPDGADSGREWVEVCNAGDSTVSIDGWKLYENDTNHGISVISGSTSLDENTCAIIADNADSFKNDYPSFSGSLLDSAFSLKNTGEQIALKDDDGSIVDSVEYDNTLGAEDTGESLHRDGDTFYAAAPSPGEADSVQIQESGNGSSGTQSPVQIGEIATLYSYESVTIQPPEDIHIRITANTTNPVVGSYTQFVVETYDATGASFQDGVVTWSFGDGATSIGRVVSHKYRYEGEYTVVVEVERNGLFDRATTPIVVVPTAVRIEVGSRGDWVAVINESGFGIDISEWRILAHGQYFRFPNNTHIAAHAAVKFPREVTNLTFLNDTSVAELVFPDGDYVPMYKEVVVQQKAEDTEDVEKGGETVNESSAEVNIVAQAPATKSVIGANVSTSSTKNDTENVLSTTSSAVNEDEFSQKQNVAAVILSSGQETNKSNFQWYMLFGVLVLAVIIVVLLAKPQRLRVHGFDIIEEKDE